MYANSVDPVYTVCLGPEIGTLGLYGLNARIDGQDKIKRYKIKRFNINRRRHTTVQSGTTTDPLKCKWKTTGALIHYISLLFIYDYHIIVRKCSGYIHISQKRRLSYFSREHCCTFDVTFYHYRERRSICNNWGF